MSMFYISKSKFEHQRIHSKKNRDHTTLRLEDMVETKKSGAKIKSSPGTTVRRNDFTIAESNFCQI